MKKAHQKIWKIKKIKKTKQFIELYANLERIISMKGQGLKQKKS